MTTATPTITAERYFAPSFSFRNRAARFLWSFVYLFLFRPSPRPLHGWRRFLLRCFGARVGRGSRVFGRARIWAPWRLTVGDAAAIADDADIYNPAGVEIRDNAIVSQGAYLCGASHDYRRWDFPLVARPIVIDRHAWVAARAIVHMGVTIGEGCVIGAASNVTRDMPPWSVCAGNPCRVLKPYAKR